MRVFISLGASVLIVVSAATSVSAQYAVHNLVSDQAGAADHTDPNLTNAWGVVFNPTGFVWVSANHSGTSTLYDGNGGVQSLVVNIPTPAATTGGSPTGIVFSGGNDFLIPGTQSPSRFLWATEDGTIAAWNPNVLPPGGSPPSTQAVNVISRANAVYKGLGFATTAGGARLYAADFHNGRIDVFDGSFQPVTTAPFTDPNLPAGMAPFNVRALGGRVYVSYAQPDAAGEDDVPGPGHGVVDVFTTDGGFISRIAAGGALNSPWGMAIAPANFGLLSGALLVGNFGDGRINAYNQLTGQFLGTLNDANGQPIVIDGLWGIEFGNGVNNQPTNTLFFAAGPDDEAHGLYGRIDFVPAPGTALFAAIGLYPLTRRRR